MIPGILAAFLTFGAFNIGVVVAFRAWPRKHRLKMMLALWLGLLAAYVGIYFALNPPPLSSGEGWVFFLNGGLIYLLLFLTYSYCYFVSDHSLSVLYMMELEKSTDQRLSLEQLKQAFPYDKLLRQRMVDLQNNGFVIQQGAHYELTAKGYQRAVIAGTLKKFLHLEPGG